MRFTVNTEQINDGDIVVVRGSSILPEAVVRHFADTLRRARPKALLLMLPEYVTLSVVPEPLQWSRWTWGMCRARHGTYGRCERPRGHEDPVHAVERGMDIPMWIEQDVINVPAQETVDG